MFNFQIGLNPIQKNFTALGTINSITAIGRESGPAVEAVCQRILEIDDRMSAFKADSDVMKINLSAGIRAERINRDTFNLIKKSLYFSSITSGTFDITIRPLTSLWDFGNKINYIPDKSEITKALSLVNYNDLKLDEVNCTAFLKIKGQAIDLGSIAKGYAADEAKAILMQYEIKDALINLGGNISVMGCSPKGVPWHIGVQNPFAATGNYIGTINVSEGTIVTSGSNEQFFMKDGIRYHHILDPKTGYPADKKIMSVTVLCDSSVKADALTTALFVSGIENARSLLDSFKAEGIFVMDNHDIYVSDGLRGIFERSF